MVGGARFLNLRAVSIGAGTFFAVEPSQAYQIIEQHPRPLTTGCLQHRFPEVTAHSVYRHCQVAFARDN